MVDYLRIPNLLFSLGDFSFPAMAAIMNFRRFGSVLITTVLLIPLVFGGKFAAAENETLLEKMEREQAGQHDPAGIYHEETLEKGPARTIEVPKPLSAAPDGTRPARPLEWPPEHYMEERPQPADDDINEDFKALRVPLAENEDLSKPRSVTFIAAEDAHLGVKEIVAHNPAKADDKVELTQKPYSNYILGAGDKLKITVFGEADLSGNFTVNEAGQISYPLVGEVDVLKLNVLQVKDKITRLLKQGYLKDPNIAIEVVEFRPFYITGEVRAPGSYSYVADMSIMNAVILAGGFTFRAEQDEVEILRNTASGTIMLKDMETDEKVVPGDIILVKERFF